MYHIENQKANKNRTTTMIIIETEPNVTFVQTLKKHSFPSVYALANRQINHNIGNIL